MKSLVSIIVMIYNNKQYIKECLNSILNQSYKNIEIIISDDNSNNFDENDINEIKEYIKNNNKGNITNYIVSKNDKNLGTVKNCNKSILLSSGEYIMYLSCDDSFFNENVVSDVVKFFNDTDYLIATAMINTEIDENDESLTEEDKIMKERYKESFKSAVDNKEYLFNDDPRMLYLNLCKSNFISGACTYFRRELVLKYGLYDYDYILLEDWPRYLSITRRGCKIGFIPRYTLNYRVGGVSTGNITNVSTDTQINFIKEKSIKDCQTAAKEINPYAQQILNSQTFYNQNKQKQSNLEISKYNNYKLKYYIRNKNKNYFLEDDCVEKEIKPYLKNIIEKIEIKNNLDIAEIRIDPLDTICVIKINSIYGIKNNEKIDLSINRSNYSTKYEDIYFFFTKEPQIYINLLDFDIETLYIDYEILSYDTVMLD